MQFFSTTKINLYFIFAFCSFILTSPALAISTNDFNAIMQKQEQRRLAIAKTMEASTVFVIGENKNDEIGMGTGFVVAHGYVLTNAHVVEGNHSFYIIGKHMKPTQATLIKKIENDVVDFALLKFTPQTDMPILSFNINPGHTDRVSAWGYPYLVAQFDQNIQKVLSGHYEYLPPLVYTEGTISAFVHNAGGETIIHSANIAQGNSGGPLINLDGEVVGVNTWVGSSSDDAAFVNGALTAKAAVSFLRSCNIEPQIAGSTAYNDSVPLYPTHDTVTHSPIQNAENFLSLIETVENSLGITNPVPNPPSSSIFSSIFSLTNTPSTSTTETTFSAELSSEIISQLKGDAKSYYPDALKGDLDAITYIGMSLYMGSEAPEIPELGIAWLNYASIQKQPAAMNLLGSIYVADMTYQNPKEGLELVRGASEIAPEFASALAYFLCLAEVLGVECDFDKAVKAAEKGLTVNDAEAMAILAYLYATGLAGKTDEKYARELATKAIEENNTIAYGVLGYLNFIDSASKSNQKKSFEYTQKAANDNDAFALGLLAHFYMNGEGVIVDFEKAFSLAEESANQGNEMGQYVLGSLYAHKDFSRKDPALAWAYLDLAARKTFPSSALEARTVLEKTISPQELATAKQHINTWRKEWKLPTLY